MAPLLTLLAQSSSARALGVTFSSKKYFVPATVCVDPLSNFELRRVHSLISPLRSFCLWISLVAYLTTVTTCSVLNSSPFRGFLAPTATDAESFQGIRHRKQVTASSSKRWYITTTVHNPLGSSTTTATKLGHNKLLSLVKGQLPLKNKNRRGSNLT